jgi:hypothetical protein
LHLHLNGVDNEPLRSCDLENGFDESIYGTLIEVLMSLSLKGIDNRLLQSCGLEDEIDVLVVGLVNS